MFLLDTNVISELRKVRAGKGNAGVAKWTSLVDAADLYVSVVSIHELEIGIRLSEHRDPAQGAVLRAWMDENVLPAFGERILAIDLAIAQRSAALRVPNPRPVLDGLIAATALVHGMTVVTRNVDDFEPMGVAVLDPWSGQA